MIPELLSIYPEGSDITIMNTFYQYAVWEDGKKLSDDFIILVYKDNKTGKKYHKTIYEPEYTFYVLKEGEKEVPYSRLFIERDKVEPVTVKFKELEKKIAEVTGNEEFYKVNMMNKNRKELGKLHTNPNIFYSDANIEDHYRFKFAQTYSNEIGKISKAFFDIEVDGKFALGDFVEMGECEINCVSFCDEGTDKIYTFILRNLNNPLIEQFENKISSGKLGFNEIHQFISENVGGPDMMEKYGLSNTQFDIRFFDYEIELIKDLFKTIHQCEPDFVEGWNSSAFDLEYIIERVKVLGYDPADILANQSWKEKIVKNYVDRQHLNELAERGDYTFISGNSVFIDQMLQYASRRKSKIGSYKSVKLDDIGLLEAGVRKLDYSHITKSVTELPWLDFETFVLYNIMDVVVQKCIEVKCNDLEYIFSKCVTNNTIYRKGHRQTIYLINRMCNDWYKMGYIIGNNINRWNEKPPKYLGALVGDPLHTNDFSKLKINGRPIFICDNLMDFDYKSLYPSIMLEFNIAPNTQYGKIVIPDKVYKNENAYGTAEEQYSRGGEFIENLVTDNIIEFCKRWYYLAGVNEIIEDIDEYYIKNLRGINCTIPEENRGYSNLIKAGFGTLSPFEGKGRIYNPVKFLGENEPYRRAIADYSSPNRSYMEIKESSNATTNS